MKVDEAKIEGGFLDLILRNKCKLSIPVEDLKFLEGASTAEIENFELLKGSKVYWPDLDEELVVNNVKNKFFAGHKIHLIDQVMVKWLKDYNETKGGSPIHTNSKPTYCGNRVYKWDEIKLTSKLDEVTCKICMRSINSAKRRVGHIVTYYNDRASHVDAPDGSLWIHPIKKRIRDV